MKEWLWGEKAATNKGGRNCPFQEGPRYYGRGSILLLTAPVYMPPESQPQPERGVYSSRARRDQRVAEEEAQSLQVGPRLFFFSSEIR